MNATSLKKDDMIRRIHLLGGEYDPDSNLDIYDQLLICESLVNSTPVDPNDNDGKIITNLNAEENERNGSVIGSVNDIGKRQVNSIETQKKLQAIFELTTCGYRTSPRAVESLLKIIFSKNTSNESHWLWVAQHYTPKSINSVISHMQKAHKTGTESIKNPAAYFTFTLKNYHPLRSKFKRDKNLKT